jgi:ribosomal protein S18 acetylase RimI-like enzyme
MIFKYEFQSSYSTQIKSLYIDAGWTAYTDKFETLIAGIENSLDLITAWDGEVLVGLVRAVGDGHTILYIQDILVLKIYQRKGIGKTLVQKLLERHTIERQVVLMTEDSADTKAFYESLGFLSLDKDGGIGFGMNRVIDVRNEK